ncbi:MULTISPECIES: MBL fold metallo-hydrolase [Metabacillus]|jgi:flavorubredoxin|uniref:Metallo-beta-lactamase domain-containing protein n=3 Tax=Metabacillus TaxID=2675233 RepID=A0A179T2E3_9BACI|nr:MULTISPECIES: MBL fold metallo-hydrolase [Metabacillus]OAS86633.1 hypothetical protein A6K24_03730 [Metabacillus litoralis]QNF29294.1 hypothetical protein HUW50_18495 [Metabacillus sp. KUDC1714]
MVFLEEQNILFESSANPSISNIIEGLAAFNIPLEKIAFIIVTHIQLDHAGCERLLLEKCQNAKLVVLLKKTKYRTRPARFNQSSIVVNMFY